MREDGFGSRDLGEFISGRIGRRSIRSCLKMLGEQVPLHYYELELEEILGTGS